MTTSDLEELDDNVWSIDHADFSLVGIAIGTKTGVVKLTDDRLALLSPGPLTEQQLSAIRQLGDVAAIVATNRLHHLFLEQACEAFPDARLIGAPGLPSKRDDLDFDAEISQQSFPAPVDNTFEHHVVQGFEQSSETVLFHPPTETLFVTDIGFNVQDVQGLWPRLFFWINGGWGEYELTFIARQYIDDSEAFLDSIDTILEWPFSRIWLPHGEIVRENAHERFRSGYEKLRS